MKKPIIAIMILLCIALTACSNSVFEMAAENEKPYSIYTHTDEDGCEYLIVYDEEYDIYEGFGLGAGITPKVKQPVGCGKE